MGAVPRAGDEGVFWFTFILINKHKYKSRYIYEPVGKRVDLDLYCGAAIAGGSVGNVAYFCFSFNLRRDARGVFTLYYGEAEFS